MASDPPLRNALFATRAVSSGTSGHGFGCIDMMTRFCGPERGQGNRTAAANDRDQHHNQRARHHAACYGSVTELGSRISPPHKPARRSIGR